MVRELLALELTSLVHGREEAEKALEASHALFSGDGDDSNMPTTTLTGDELTENAINIIDLALRCGLAKSKSELRRLIQQGGLFLNGEAVSDIGLCVTRDQLSDGVKLRKGKKVFHKAILS